MANLTGIHVGGTNNTSGGRAAAARNVIVGNGTGVNLSSGSVGNVVAGN